MREDHSSLSILSMEVRPLNFIKMLLFIYFLFFAMLSSFKPHYFVSLVLVPNVYIDLPSIVL